MPVPFLEDVRGLRISAFGDTGAIWGPGDQIDLGELRYSAGVAGFWLSPLGPINVSVGFPLRKESGDETQTVQFTVGASF